MTLPSLLFRAAGEDDLPHLERFAAASATGITTLPDDRGRLLARLQRAAQAFGSEDDASGEEIYLFVVEDLDTGRVVGTSGIAASAGFADRFYSYRNEMVVHASATLGLTQRIHTLHLCHDLTGYTLLTSFFVEPDWERTLAPQVLSRARLLFVAEFAERFSDRIAAESPGVADEDGVSPFWNAVGRRFFDMDYPAAELLAGGRSKAFIAELMPHSPIYVPLLPERAQWSIGQLHPVGELPFGILLDEGFDTETYVDIFDGGPTVDARVAMLKTVRRSRAGALRMPAALSPARRLHLVCNTERGDFRATLAWAEVDSRGIALEAAAAARLAAVPGDRLRAAAVDLAAEPGVAA
jgi:arginine N-succinyltransferase